MAQTEPLGAERDTTGEHPTHVAKVIELIGTSETSFDDALENAIEDAGKTLRHINGCEVIRHTVACDDGGISEYRVDVRLAFGIER